MSQAEEDARLLIAEVETALARGTKHFDRQGRPLLTVAAVLQALMQDGEIVFEPPRRR